MLTTRFDIECENFDLFFAKQIPSISPQAKEGLPKDVTFKIFRRGGEFNEKNTSKLGFLAKLYILWKCLRKRWWIVVEDEENGLSIEQFFELQKAVKARDMSIPKADGFSSCGTFITASKELADTFDYLNRLSVSPAYNFITKAKNKIPNKTAEWRAQMNYICRFLVKYEGSKKAWVSAMGISIPEFLVLIYTYHGKEVKGSTMYHEVYKRAYQSSPNKIKKAFSTLQQRGYLKKTGESRGAVMQITSLGVDVVSSILTKYAVNC